MTRRHVSFSASALQTEGSFGADDGRSDVSSCESSLAWLSMRSDLGSVSLQQKMTITSAMRKRKQTTMMGKR